MTRLRKSLRIIHSKISDWILLAYVIWFIRAEELRSKFESWTYKQDSKIQDRD